jgi:hypothetical protein
VRNDNSVENVWVGFGELLCGLLFPKDYKGAIFRRIEGAFIETNAYGSVSGEVKRSDKNGSLEKKESRR